MDEVNIITVDQAARIMRDALRDAIKRHSLWYMIQGLLLVLAGIVALIFPLISSVAIVVLLGWLLIISGILQVISMIGAKNVPHFWLQLISVVLSTVIGFMFLTDPGGGLVALALLLVVFFIVGGMARVVFALTIRPLNDWGWVLASGIVGLLLGVYLFASLPVTAAWLLGLLFGIQLLSEGAALTYMTWKIRNA
jgi:uncharacterized membrane protein HdeD (DUF308 family)